ncbi:hypothetical protein [Rhizobium binae]|uniref:PH domain-containing protein n=1 Tax=Rhizobium binae TaxID=1138190 RepID=A0ABV2MQP2_9HYPH|nr:hypothetical protein [Rhizobium binae]NKL50418.1 hypothetical protein [Rhizobium leguminosarum bv. viciae]MBX4926351.1 hypothetical protein [Rhizobium binae]MBX4936499.1 hypothetical protein [Rhizobium binae]MBX4942822.1 hypothetical protein [Rhizobium binae]MBX4949811.1 hypothetical protein [Rhizobium binae]
MNDRAEVSIWLASLERQLQARGLIDAKGEVVANGGALPADIADVLDGFVENATELNGLLKIGRAARRGEPLSDAVLSAARLMMRGVCQMLQHIDDG